MSWNADEPVTQVALQMAIDSVPLDADATRVVQRAEEFKQFLTGEPSGTDAVHALVLRMRDETARHPQRIAVVSEQMLEAAMFGHHPGR